MGLSRNKVAVPEGAAGTPPFWSGPGCRVPSRLLVKSLCRVLCEKIQGRGPLPRQSRSSVGQSATLIMWRPAVQVCPGLRGAARRYSGGLAQLARAPALQAGGRRFESVILHPGTDECREVFDMLGQARRRRKKRKNKEGPCEWDDRGMQACLHAMSACRGLEGPRVRGSRQGRTVDAQALAGDEGRGKLRKSAGRRKRPLIRGFPNGATRHPKGGIPLGGRRTRGTETS